MSICILGVVRFFSREPLPLTIIDKKIPYGISKEKAEEAIYWRSRGAPRVVDNYFWVLDELFEKDCSASKLQHTTVLLNFYMIQTTRPTTEWTGSFKN